MTGLNWQEVEWYEDYVLFDKELIPSLCSVVRAERKSGLDNGGKVKDGRRGLERGKLKWRHKWGDQIWILAQTFSDFSILVKLPTFPSVLF